MADDRGALITLLGDELGWDWHSAPGVPSSRKVLGDLADCILAAGFRRSGSGLSEEAVLALCDAPVPFADPSAVQTYIAVADVRKALTDALGGDS